MSRILKSFVLPADELSDDDVGAPPKEKDLAARLAQKQKHDAYMEELKKALLQRYTQVSGKHKKLGALDFSKDQFMKKEANSKALATSNLALSQ